MNPGTPDIWSKSREQPTVELSATNGTSTSLPLEMIRNHGTRGGVMIVRSKDQGGSEQIQESRSTPELTAAVVTLTICAQGQASQHSSMEKKGVH